MTTITLEKARQELSDLIKRALDGEEILISADGKQVRLAPQPAPKDAGSGGMLATEPERPASFDKEVARKRGFGAYKGQFQVTDAFFDPLPEEELRAWEGDDKG